MLVKDKYKRAYMRMAYEFAKTSEATRLKVGCLVVKADKIISVGVNGTPEGWPTNSCEDRDGSTAWFTRHAEAAALDKLVVSTESSEGASIFVTHAPCKSCALRIRSAKIMSVYYCEDYRDSSGIDYLKQSGVIVNKLENIYG